MEREIFRDHVAATSKIAYSGPSCAKIAFSASAFWHYVFGDFSKIRSIFTIPVL